MKIKLNSTIKRIEARKPSETNIGLFCYAPPVGFIDSFIERPSGPYVPPDPKTGLDDELVAGGVNPQQAL